MTLTLIFDLSEVIIAGLVGIEKPLSTYLHIDPETILPAFSEPPFYELCCGRLSENQYLSQVVHQQKWHIPKHVLKRVIRDNFHRRVPGMVELASRLTQEYELILLSDHAIEWVEYIHTIHPFLNLFKSQFYSFELKQTKKDPSTFQKVLHALERQPEQCLLVDDSMQNVDSAAVVGIPGIRFTTAEALMSKFKSYGILAREALP